MPTSNEEDEPPPPTPFPLPPLSCALSPGLPRRIRPPPEVSSYAGAGATTTVSSNGDDVDAQLLAARPPRHPSCASLPSAARVSRCLCPRSLIATLTSLLSTAPTRSSAAAADPRRCWIRRAHPASSSMPSSHRGVAPWGDWPRHRPPSWLLSSPAMRSDDDEGRE